MSGDATPAEVQIKHVCEYCKSEVLVDAAKCPHCQSFLGWVGKIRNSTAELAVVSLVISIVALCLPVIKADLMPQHSDLVVTVLRPSGSKLEFVVSNAGNRPAAITEAGVEYTTIRKGEKLYSWVLLDGETYKATLMEPEKSYRFAPQMSSGLPPYQPNPGVESELPVLMRGLHDDCALKLVYVDFDGSEKVIRKSYRCIPG